MMKQLIYTMTILLAVIVAFWLGHHIATIRTKAAITQGPWSDDVLPALHSMSSAKINIQRGNTNVLKELEQTECHLERISEWMQNWPSRGQQTSAGDILKIAPGK